MTIFSYIKIFTLSLLLSGTAGFFGFGAAPDDHIWRKGYAGLMAFITVPTTSVLCSIAAVCLDMYYFTTSSSATESTVTSSEIVLPIVINARNVTVYVILPILSYLTNRAYSTKMVSDAKAKREADMKRWTSGRVIVNNQRYTTQ